jgi:hypothetical protein
VARNRYIADWLSGEEFPLFFLKNFSIVSRNRYIADWLSGGEFPLFFMLFKKQHNLKTA